jgi:hypothetical protein
MKVNHGIWMMMCGHLEDCGNATLEKLGRELGQAAGKDLPVLIVPYRAGKLPGYEARVRRVK